MPTGLLDLPTEIIQRIVELIPGMENFPVYTTYYDVQRLRGSCRRLYAAIPAPPGIPNDDHYVLCIEEVLRLRRCGLLTGPDDNGLLLLSRARIHINSLPDTAILAMLRHPPGDRALENARRRGRHAAKASSPEQLVALDLSERVPMTLFCSAYFCAYRYVQEAADDAASDETEHFPHGEHYIFVEDFHRQWEESRINSMKRTRVPPANKKAVKQDIFRDHNIQLGKLRSEERRAQIHSDPSMWEPW